MAVLESEPDGPPDGGAPAGGLPPPGGALTSLTAEDCTKAVVWAEAAWVAEAWLEVVAEQAANDSIRTSVRGRMIFFILSPYLETMISNGCSGFVKMGLRVC
jgi:hypothetical protein